MYTIKEIIALFRRSLKENGHYRMLLHTDAVKEMESLFTFTNPWVSFDRLHVKTKGGKIYTLRGYRLLSFYQFLYTVHDEWLLKQIATELEQFLRNKGMLSTFINDFNDMMKRPNYANKDSMFYAGDPSCIDTIYQYVMKKLDTCPYELMRNSFPWDRTNTGTNAYALLHTEWIKHVKEIQDKRMNELKNKKDNN